MEGDPLPAERLRRGRDRRLQAQQGRGTAEPADEDNRDTPKVTPKALRGVTGRQEDGGAVPLCHRPLH